MFAAFKTLIFLLVIMLMYKGMVTAFHLLNLPSDEAVREGVGLLLLTATGGFFACRGLWRWAA